MDQFVYLIERFMYLIIILIIFALPGLLCWLLEKIELKIVKYLIPIISIIIFIYSIIEYNNYVCTLGLFGCGFQNMGNALLFIYAIFAFVSSLIVCIILEIKKSIIIQTLNEEDIQKQKIVKE